MTGRAIALAATLVLSLVALVALADPVAGASDASPPAGTGAVLVDEVILRRIPSWDADQPTAATLTVRGSLPTSCREARWSVEATAGAIDVVLWSESAEDTDCVEVTELFAIVIPIDKMIEGEQVVWLNGEAIGRIDDQVEIVADDAMLVGAGWSFGYCAGLCRAELGLDGPRVEVTAGDYLPVPGDRVNRGLLTGTGRASFDDAMEHLDGTVLQQLYGCPDCADGGAVSLTFEQAGVISEHLMNYRAPPDELAELYRLSMAVIDALMACRSDALVEVDEACVAVERR
jgi:hypothetical protein